MIELKLSLPDPFMSVSLTAFGWKSGFEIAPFHWRFFNWSLGDGEHMTAIGPLYLSAIHTHSKARSP
jgi:hypothetical protein